MKLTAKNIWFTSDTHYGHKNICRGVTNWKSEDPAALIAATRDFPTLEIMNETIVSNINSVVAEDDWLIHLGDWSFGGIERITEFREQINCKNIVLILGNHDQHIQKEKSLHKLFTHVAHYEELKITQKHNSHKFVLCHYPIISWNGMRKNTHMLHGHQHLKGDAILGQGKRMDIGIDGSKEFRPYHVEEVVDLLKDRISIEP